MDKVSVAIEKRFETPTAIEHKEWNAAIEDKRRQKKQLKKLKRLEKIEASAVVDSLIKDRKEDITKAIKSAIIKTTYEMYSVSSLRTENETDKI